MDFLNFKAIFKENFRLNGLETYVTDENIELFYRLTEIMLETNQQMNVTAIREVEKIIPLHYADCVKIAEHIPEGVKVIDIGCGGGFPTLPLAIVRKDIYIDGVDSTSKKVKYVANLARQLGLHRVNTFAARAEELIQMPQMREKFDVVVSRAVARLNILSELCLPFVKVGGKAIFMKGAAGYEELSEAQNGIIKLGGVGQQTIDEVLYITNENAEKRTQILIDKVSNTPTQYPRQFGQIKKKPL